MYETAYQRLEESLTDLVAEEQAKLGYRKEEIRLYYPLSTLNHFFAAQFSAEEMQEALIGFSDASSERLGKTTVTHKAERFCFHLSPEASEYVHEQKAKNEFIEQLVALLSRHDITLEQVTAFFKSWDEACEVEPVNNGEFDILIRFRGRDDRYYYCFKDEGCHIIYHRFLPEDYEDFGF